MSEDKRPKVNSAGQRELDKAAEQVDAFEDNVKTMSLDRMNQAPKMESIVPELSQKDKEKSRDIYLKPERAIGSREKFNEDYRKDYTYAMEYVKFMALNKEIGGEAIEMWTKPYAGMPCEFWKVPVNKEVYGPRHLAEQIRKCSYHRFIMDQSTSIGGDNNAKYYGAMAVDTTVQRLDAIPVSERKSIFMGASGF